MTLTHWDSCHCLLHFTVCCTEHKLYDGARAAIKVRGLWAISTLVASHCNRPASETKTSERPSEKWEKARISGDTSQSASAAGVFIWITAGCMTQWFDFGQRKPAFHYISSSGFVTPLETLFALWCIFTLEKQSWGEHFNTLVSKQPPQPPEVWLCTHSHFECPCNYQELGGDAKYFTLTASGKQQWSQNTGCLGGNSLNVVCFLLFFSPINAQIKRYLSESCARAERGCCLDGCTISDLPPFSRHNSHALL